MEIRRRFIHTRSNSYITSKHPIQKTKSSAPLKNAFFPPNNSFLLLILRLQLLFKKWKPLGPRDQVINYRNKLIKALI